jgi:hypothetical protein
LLKELHILTRDGKLNQDSRRKLKQVYHLYQFIEPLLETLQKDHADISLVDHGAGSPISALFCMTCSLKSASHKAKRISMGLKPAMNWCSDRQNLPGVSIFPVCLS